MKKKLVCMTLAIMMSAAQIASVNADVEQDLREEQAWTSAQLDATYAQISALWTQKEALQNQIADLNTNLVDVIVSIDLLKNDIASKENDIAETKENLQKAENARDKQYEAMKKRIQYLYEKGGSDAWFQMMMGAESLSELLTKAEYTQKMYEYDRESLESYVTTINQVQQLGERYESEKAELEGMEQEMEAEQANLEYQLEVTRNASANCDDEIAYAQSLAADYEALIIQQQAQIEILEAERIAAEEAERAAAQRAASESNVSTSRGGDYLYDENGDIVYDVQVDEDGNAVYDEDGDPVYVAQMADGSQEVSYTETVETSSGDYLYDEDGDIVYDIKVDEDGNAVYDEDGDPIYVPQMADGSQQESYTETVETSSGDYLYDEDGDIVYDVKVDEDGNVVYDEDGDPIYVPQMADGSQQIDTYEEDSVTYDDMGGSDDYEYDEYGNVIDSDNTVNSYQGGSGNGSGSSVVDYATQFVGNPYVWGGTSLTNGADCSGFVQSVYSNFGVSLPRTSYEQQNAGYEVSYSDAQPGDLICYGGHVAIYMGNGQIVHASNSRDGIKISNDATYRTIVSVRRLVD